MLTFNISAQIDGSPSLPAAACRFFCVKITSKCPDEFREETVRTKLVCPGHLDSSHSIDIASVVVDPGGPAILAISSVAKASSASLRQ